MKKFMRRLQQGMDKEKGFTLVELMIVVAIIGILAAIAIPQFQAYRTRSYNANAKAVNKNIVGSQSDLNAELGAYGETTGTANTLVHVVQDIRGAATVASSNTIVALAIAGSATVPGSILSGTQGATSKQFAVPNGLGAAMFALANTPATAVNVNTSTSYVILTRHLQGDTAYGTDSDQAGTLYSVSHAQWVGNGTVQATIGAANTSNNAFDLDGNPSTADVPGGGLPSPNWSSAN